MDLTIFVRHKGLVVTVRAGNAESKALQLSVAGRFFDPQCAGLRHVHKANPGFVFHLVGFIVFGDLHIVGVLIQQERIRRFGFFYEHATVFHMGHFINAGAGFFHQAKQFVALVQFFIPIAVAVHFKFCARQFVVGIILIHLGQAEIPVNALVFNGDFHHSPVLVNRHGEHLVGKNEAGHALYLF